MIRAGVTFSIGFAAREWGFKGCVVVDPFPEATSLKRYLCYITKTDWQLVMYKSCCLSVSDSQYLHSGDQK